MPGIDLTLGEHTYRVQPQRHAYLRRKLGESFGSLDEFAEVSETSGLLDLLGDRLYDVLAIFIPDIMERWEFDGFASEEAMQKGTYSAESDCSPTPPEIKLAFITAIQVNDFDWVKLLGKWIGPDLIRAQLRVAMTKWAEEQNSPSSASPSLPPTNGASAPMSSSPSEPIAPGI